MPGMQADKRLHEIDALGVKKIKEAEQQAFKIIEKTEDDAKTMEADFFVEIRRKEAKAMLDSKAVLKAEEDESRRAMEREAASMVRRAIAKMVQLAPEQIDEALIARAVKEARQSI